LHRHRRRCQLIGVPASSLLPAFLIDNALSDIGCTILHLPEKMQLRLQDNFNKDERLFVMARSSSAIGHAFAPRVTSEIQNN
jgi:hypothetical protein